MLSLFSDRRHSERDFIIRAHLLVSCGVCVVVNGILRAMASGVLDQQSPALFVFHRHDVQQETRTLIRETAQNLKDLAQMDSIDTTTEVRTLA